MPKTKLQAAMQEAVEVAALELSAPLLPSDQRTRRKPSLSMARLAELLGAYDAAARYVHARRALDGTSAANMLTHIIEVDAAYDMLVKAVTPNEGEAIADTEPL